MTFCLRQKNVSHGGTEFTEISKNIFVTSVPPWLNNYDCPAAHNTHGDFQKIFSVAFRASVANLFFAAKQRLL